MVCNNRNTSTIRRGAAIILAVIMLMMAVVTNKAVSVGAKTTSNEIVGKTLAEVLGMDGNTYINWLYSHQSDKYYLTTPTRDGITEIRTVIKQTPMVTWTPRTLQV